MTSTDPANRPAALVGDREIAATRIFDAPRELVFKMWTDPKHIGQWWGPNGFTTTTFSMDAKPGGVWRFVMTGPDGRDYKNRITFSEFVEPERITFKHGGDDDTEPVSHETFVSFSDHGPGKTKLEMRMLFASPEARDFVVKNYGAVEGLSQTLGRLGETLAEGLAFVISREFDAPVGAVWKAWSDRESLMQWFGPKGFTMTHANLDFRPGGVFHYCLRSPDGKEMWGKFVYREIIPHKRIVLVNSFSDAHGNLTRHPMSPTWPAEMLSITTFTECDGKTLVTIQWAPINPTAVERQTFDAGREGMTMGWTGTFEQLAEYLGRHGRRA